MTPQKQLEIEKLMDRFGIKNYTRTSQGSIIAKQSVGLSGSGLTKIPIRFAEVMGDFDCSNNQLTTLENSPRKVTGSFYCYNNQLTSLVGSPEVVDGDFHCSRNKIITLVGGPKDVGGDYNVRDNLLTSVKGFPFTKVSSSCVFEIINNLVDNLDDFEHIRCSLLVQGNPIWKCIVKNNYSKEIIEKLYHTVLIHQIRESTPPQVIKGIETVMKKHLMIPH